MARIDFDRLAPDYERSRALPAEGIADWRRAVAPYLPPADARPILDLGCGTGQFAEAFADGFHHSVIGVDPSRGMLREAQRRRASARARFLLGTADAIPLSDRSCAAGWLSAVIHHIPDLRACARELRRVLLPHSPLLIRGAFPERQQAITVFRFFPEAAAVVDTFPTVSATVTAFASAGFSPVKLLRVAQHSAPSLAALRERVVRRADTTLAALREEEFERGLGALDAEIRAQPASGPVIDYLDLLVLH